MRDDDKIQKNTRENKRRKTTKKKCSKVVVHTFTEITPSSKQNRVKLKKQREEKSVIYYAEQDKDRCIEFKLNMKQMLCKIFS